MSTSTRTTGDDLRLLTVDEACDRLRVSRWTFYRLVNAGELATVRIHSRRLVTQQALAAFLRARSSTGVTSR